MVDVCILGGGPAGLSAGIYALRAGMNTLILSNQQSALLLAKKVDNYFGFPSVSGQSLLESGMDQFHSLGGEYKSCEITSALFGENGYSVHTTEGDFTAKTLILALGRGVHTSKIPGEAEFLGRGVSRCAVCDGYFFKKKKVAVVGNGSYALEEAKQLSSFADEIVILTNGKESEEIFPYKVASDKISCIYGDSKVSGVRFDNGNEMPIDGLFIAEGHANTSDLALKLGVQVQNGGVLVDTNGMTNLPGVFAAGDCLGGLCQVSVAVGSGALAGQRAAEYIRDNF